MSIYIYSLAGYAHLYRSLLRCCGMPANEAKYLVYRLNTSNLDSARYINRNPNKKFIEATPAAFSRCMNRFDCRPYRTEVQLYKALESLESNIIRAAITEEQREALAMLQCIMCNLEYRFFKSFGVEIFDDITVYDECVSDLVPNEDEPSVCMLQDWLLLPSA